MLKEVLVVEGKMDTVAIRKALEADTIETGGFTLAPYTLRAIEAAYKKRGIIILTDPDGAGERIRRFLTERFPEAGQAFIPKVQATAHNDVGVEQAQPEAILAALAGLVLMFRPGEGTSVLMTVLGITLLAEGILNFSTMITAVKIIRHQQPDTDTVEVHDFRDCP